MLLLAIDRYGVMRVETFLVINFQPVIYDIGHSF